MGWQAIQAAMDVGDELTQKKTEEQRHRERNGGRQNLSSMCEKFFS
jgi:hypothetical protein